MKVEFKCDACGAMNRVREPIPTPWQRIVEKVAAVLGVPADYNLAPRALEFRLGYETVCADVVRARAERDAARDNFQKAVEERDKALSLLGTALALLENATTDDPHGPWCNGVHELNTCEGSTRAADMIGVIRIAVRPGQDLRTLCIMCGEVHDGDCAR